MGSVTAPENIRWLIPVWAWFALVVWGVATASCGDVRFVIPSEVEESLDIFDHAAVETIKRCLDFARHDKLTGVAES